MSQAEKHERSENPVENPVADTMPGKNGGTLKRGGVNPGGGRPPDEFRQRMRQLATREETEQYLEKCLSGDFGPKVYQRALNFVTDHGYGRPVQSVQMSGADGGPMEIRIIETIIDPRDDPKS